MSDSSSSSAGERGPAPRTDERGGEASSLTPLLWTCGSLAVVVWLASFVGLGRTPFWVDESIAAFPAMSVQERGLPFNEWDIDYIPWQLEHGLWDPATPLYRYALALATALPGFSEFSVRAFSLVCGLGAAIMLFLLSSRLFDRRIGLLAACLLLTNPSFINFAREGRHFTFVMFLALLSLVLLMRARDRPESRTAGVWALPAVGTLLAQTLGYALAPVVGCFVLLTGIRNYLGRSSWPFYAAAAVPYLLVLALYGNTLPFFNHTGCDNHGAGCQPSPFYYGLVAAEFLSPTIEGREYNVAFTVFSLAQPIFLIGVGVVLLGGIRQRIDRIGACMLLAWWLVPFLLLSSREVKFPRYIFQWIMPPLMLGVAVGIVWIASRVRSRRQRSAVMAALAIIVMLSPQLDVRNRDLRNGLWRYLNVDVFGAPTDNFSRTRSISGELAEKMGPGDAVVAVFDPMGLQYYLDRPVYGFLNSRRTDEFFTGLLDEAERSGTTVFFVDPLPDLNFCLTGPEDPVHIDCREKFAEFYRRCTSDPGGSSACVRVPYSPTPSRLASTAPAPEGHQ